MEQDIDTSSIITKRTIYKMYFKEEQIQNFEIEKITLFDEIQDEYPELAQFTIYVYSPDKYYYNGIINSGILKAEEAWELYIRILKQQILNENYKNYENTLNKKNTFINLYNHIILYYKNNNIL